MKILLQRYPSFNEATIGGLFMDGTLECCSLEDDVREIPGVPVEQWKIPGKTAIPSGTYKVVIDFSPHFQRKLPHILDVAGFEGIRIHGGNFSTQTEGCVLVGMVKTNSTISQCKMALNIVQGRIQQALDAGEEVHITIKNAAQT